jgi:hypothetical protein
MFQSSLHLPLLKNVPSINLYCGTALYILLFYQVYFITTLSEEHMAYVLILPRSNSIIISLLSHYPAEK